MYSKFLLFSGFIFSFFNAFAQTTDPTPYCGNIYHNDNPIINNHIINVSLNTLNSSTGDEEYTNNTGLLTNLEIGQSYTLSVELAGTDAMGVGAWIDYNQNDVFEDQELVMNIVDADGLNGVQQRIITIPEFAFNDTTRIRIRTLADTLYFLANSEENMLPCSSPYGTTLTSGVMTDNFANGETEDYSVIFSGACVNSEMNVVSFDFDDRSYDIVQERLNWEDAAECAKNRGGFLAQPEYEPEANKILTEVLVLDLENDSTSAFSGGNVGYLWLGGTDNVSERTWRWDGDNDGNGEQFWEGSSSGISLLNYYNNWEVGPSGFGFKDALGLSIDSSAFGNQGAWVDLIENEELYYIIEYPTPGGAVNDYCLSSYSTLGDVDDFHISAIKLENIDTISTNGGIVDFYDVSTDLKAGLAYSAYVTMSMKKAHGIGGWIDYNQDGVFDADEEISIQVNSDELDSVNLELGFNIPLTATLGQTKMRIRAVYDEDRFVTNGEMTVSPCENYEEGETEDYTINIIDQGLGDTPAVIVTSKDNVLNILQESQQLQCFAQTNPTVEPVTWSITPQTGDAIVDADGLVSPVSNGTVKVVATSFIGGSQITGELDITIFNQSKFLDLEVVGDTSLSLCQSQNGSYTVDVDMKDGFTNTVNFELTGLPANVNHTINPAALSGDGQITINIANNNAPFDVSVLNLNATVPGSIISENVTMELKTFNGLPFFTSNLLPQNNAVSVSQTPHLVWDESLRSDWFEVEIATDTNFTNIVFTENDIADTEFDPAFNFLLNTAYFWRVKPHNPCGSFNWSTVTKFTIQPYAGIQGCTDSTALNYNNNATVEDGSCTYLLAGCTDSEALNYNPTALTDDGTCNFDILMMRIKAFSPIEFRFAMLDDGSSGESDGVSWNFFDGQPLVIDTATTYVFDSNGVYPVQMKVFYPTINQTYTIDSTVVIEAYGCTDPFALNYSLPAVFDDGSCIAKVFGCTNPLSTNYNANANVDDGSCSVVILGCMDADAFNFNPDATNDDGSCIAKVFGCIDSTALNYDELANTDDGSCIPTIVGCMDSTSFNFNPDATVPDESCVPFYYGCTDSAATNYVDFANTDDGSCLFDAPNSSDWEVITTAENHSILLQATMDITELDPALENGDYLGVFYEDDAGNEKCAGKINWNGENTAIVAYGTEDGLDNGFANNETFIWKHWHKADNSYNHVSAAYDHDQTHQSKYANDGISSVLKIGSSVYQDIELTTGWNFISTNLNPVNPSIDSVFSNVTSDIFLVKDESGSVYWPSVGINNIGNHIIGEGYKVNMNADTTLKVKGLRLNPEDHTIDLNQGWSYIGYLREEAANVSSVMGSVSSEIYIMKNINGDVYWPQFGINNLGNLEVGKGYQINMISDTVFQFPSNETVLPSLKVLSDNKPEMYNDVLKTTRHMHVAIPNLAWNKQPVIGSEIGAFINEKLVGSALYNGHNVVIGIYGDDLKTLDGKPITFKVIENDVESVYTIHTQNQNFGLSFVENDVEVALDFKKKSEPSVLTELVNNSSLQIDFVQSEEAIKNVSIQISDYLGRTIYSSSKAWNGSKVILDLPVLEKGNYIIKVSDNGKEIETLKWLN